MHTTLISVAVFAATAFAKPLHSLQARAAVEVSGYDYAGCYTEASVGRALAGKTTYSKVMTAQLCAANCRDFNWFGVEYGQECFCGNVPKGGSNQTIESQCNMACPGDATQSCGGSYRLTMYAKAGILTTTPISYKSLGCYSEPADVRALTGLVIADDSMTVNRCEARCKAANYQYYGLEYSRECYCGNNLDRSSLKAPESDCNAPCAGNSTEKCGGSFRLNLYSNSSLPNPTAAMNTYNSVGCWTDNVQDRALTGRRYYDGAMTVQQCGLNCIGYPFFGLEYSVECYCGFFIKPTSVQVSDGNCTKTCGGDGTQKCGDNNRLNVYQYGPLSVSSSTVTSTTTTTLSLSSTTTAAQTTTTTTTTSFVPTTTTPSSSSTTTTTTSTTSDAPATTTTTSTTDAVTSSSSSSNVSSSSSTISSSTTTTTSDAPNSSSSTIPVASSSTATTTTTTDIPSSTTTTVASTTTTSNSPVSSSSSSTEAALSTTSSSSTTSGAPSPAATSSSTTSGSPIPSSVSTTSSAAPASSPTTSAAPLPVCTPPSGSNLITNPSFEQSNCDAWTPTVQDQNGYFTLTSPTTPFDGINALTYRALGGILARTSQLVNPVESGQNYKVSVNVNRAGLSSAVCYAWTYVTDQNAGQDNALQLSKVVSGNGWQQMQGVFHSQAKGAKVQLLAYCNGQEDVYFDGVILEQV